MALYRHSQYLVQYNDPAFEAVTEPGQPAPYAGIYRCMGCHREIAIAEGQALPAQSAHSHTVQQGAMRWRLTAWADHRPKKNEALAHH